MKKSTLFISILATFLFQGMAMADMRTEVKTETKKIETETKESVEDAAITAKVKESFIREKLFGDKDISAMSLHVTTTDGVVKLTGTVENEKELENAVALTKKIEGVKKVESEVKVEVHH